MKKGVIIFWSIFIAGALTRVLFSLHQEVPDMSPCLKHEVQGMGTITAEPERKEGGQIFIVSAQQLFVATTTGQPCGSKILIRMKTKLYPRFEYGQIVSFKGKISQPFNFKSDSGRSFDYKGYLAKDDVFFEIKSAVVEQVQQGAITTSTGDVLAKREPPQPPVQGLRPHLNEILDHISSILFSIKRHFVANLEHTLGEPHAALAAGLVVGEKSALGKNLLTDFRIVGLIHIVVLSGFNITIVGDAMRRFLSFLPRVWGISVGGIGIALFGVMVGGGATVVRSCFMAGIALSADLIRRDYDVIRALIFAGLVMLIQNPMILLHDPSFQLSFLATLGLILLASPIEKKLKFIPEKFGVRGIVASTIATQIFVSPYILYMMGQISIIGMVVNILVLPVIPATMLVVFLTGAGGFISLPAAQFFGWIAHGLLSYELHMVEWFARMPFASVTLPIFSGWWVVGFYVGFGVVYWWMKGKGESDKKIVPTSSLELQTIFKDFQKLSKGIWISEPNNLVETPFQAHIEVCKILNLKKPRVYFTRRTLKHVAEKSLEGKRLLTIMPVILSNMEIVCEAKKVGRYIVLKSLPHKKKVVLHGVVIEGHKDKDILIITSFVANQKYLKSFKILWRTAAF